MEANVRLTRPTDLNTVKDLDIKCYDYPLDMAEWQNLINNSGKDNAARVVVVEAFQKPVGFSVWKMESPQEGINEIVCTLYRIGVRPHLRNKGLGSVLMHKCILDAQRMQADCIRVTVPDFKCQKGDPDDVSEFLYFHGFRATGQIVHDYKHMYGYWRDGYIFEKKLGVPHVVT